VPDYRRAFVPGGTFFFTVVTERRAPLLCEPPARATLRRALAACRRRWPVRIDALVLLPDHLHAIWSLPRGDTNYSRRRAWIKKEFTKDWLACGGIEQPTSTSRQENRRRGVWQRRYWEHSVQADLDFERHCDYIHYNPVKHGLAACPADWPHSSFHRWVKLGAYPPAWGCSSLTKLSFDDILSTAFD
jgi:putative transposase